MKKNKEKNNEREPLQFYCWKIPILCLCLSVSSSFQVSSRAAATLLLIRRTILAIDADAA